MNTRYPYDVLQYCECAEIVTCTSILKEHCQSSLYLLSQRVSRDLGYLLASVVLLEIDHSYIPFYEVFPSALYDDAGSLLSLLQILLIFNPSLYGIAFFTLVCDLIFYLHTCVCLCALYTGRLPDNHLLS